MIRRVEKINLFYLLIIFCIYTFFNDGVIVNNENSNIIYRYVYHNKNKKDII